MKKLSVCLVVLFFITTLSVYADGTVTTPGNVAPTTWAIANIHMINGVGGDVGGISITIYYFDSSLNKVRTEVIELSGAEFTSFFTTTNSPVAGESGSQIKRYRMRVTKWLTDNNKITNVTPES
jgi:hypothetical protein